MSIESLRANIGRFGSKNSWKAVSLWPDFGRKTLSSHMHDFEWEEKLGSGTFYQPGSFHKKTTKSYPSQVPVAKTSPYSSLQLISNVELGFNLPHLNVECNPKHKDKLSQLP